MSRARFAIVVGLMLSMGEVVAADLTVADGVVVKFGDDAGLVIRDRVTLEGTAVFTSLSDPSIGGATLPGAPLPQPGDWRGIAIENGARVTDVQIEGAEIRYAGASGAAALSFARLPFGITGLAIFNSVIGVRAGQGSEAVLSELFAVDNGIGVLAEGHDSLRVDASAFVGNNLFGIENRSTAVVVNARGNWWGDISGPQDPVGNPQGLGDTVSAGVDYGQHLTQQPLIGCRVFPADGRYQIVMRAVRLRLTCRNAAEYRLSESPDIGATPFVAMASSANFMLSEGAGEKQVYAQYRGAQGQVRTVSMPQPFQYMPSFPAVTFLAPGSGAVLTTDPVLRVTASDVAGISRVDFLANGTLLGSATSPPYEWIWDISTTPDGSYELTAVATNGEGRTASASRMVSLERITPNPDSYSFDEGTVLFVDEPGVLANDNIATGPGLQVEVTEMPAWGTLNLAQDGTLAFDPNDPDRNGQTTFSYRLRLGGLVSPPVTASLTVLPVNDPPRVLGESFATDENVEISLDAPGLLANDVDVDSASLQAEVFAQPAHGSVQVNADGSFSYVPEVNFRGVDTFQYQVRDEQGGVAPGTVTVRVTQPPTATNDVYLVDVDTPLLVDLDDAGLLANDFDAPENDPLTASLSRDPDHGVLQLNANGTFLYTPDHGFVGLDTFRYQVSDEHSSSNVANVTLAVGITSLPRAFPDAYALLEDQELVVPASVGVLINDEDADTPIASLRPTVTGISFYGIEPGSLQMQPDGGFRVRPMANFYGDSFFLYQIFDGTSVSNEVIVRLTVEPVNDGVVAEDDAYGVLRNGVFQSGYDGSIEGNDTYDPDYVINYEIVQPIEYGHVNLDPATGRLTYTPPPDFAGTDTFVYRAFQVETGIGDIATVSFRINAPPVAVSDTYVLDEDSTTEVLPTLIFNDYDPDGDSIRLTTTRLSDGYGTCFLNLDHDTIPTSTQATVTGHFYGTRIFSYGLTDGLSSSSGLITYVVRPIPDDPIAVSDSYLTQQNTPLQISSPSLGVLHNDFDPDNQAAATGPDLLPVEPELLTVTSHGVLTFAADGTFNYVPQTDFSGTDTFTYRVLDGTGRFSVPTTVYIRVNTAPQAVTDSYVVNEDAILVATAANGVLANDVDFDGDSLEVAFMHNGCKPCNGVLSLRADGGFRYLPDANFNGTDDFYYEVTDDVAGSSIGHVLITILPINDAPVTEPDTYRTDEDVVLIATTTLGVLRNDREVDGESLTNAQLISPPSHGAATVSATGGISYTSDQNFNGNDSFRYRVFDDSGLATDEDVEVAITAVNDAPDAVNDSYAVDRDQMLNVPVATGLLANDHDVDGPTLSAAVVGPPAHGQLNLNANGSFSYMPNGTFVGIDQFQYQVDDGLGSVDSAVVAVNVRDIMVPVSITVGDDQYLVSAISLSIAAPGVLANDSVTGAPSLSAALVMAPQVGTVVLDADGAFTYTAPSGYNGEVSFSYAASAGGSSELGLVTLVVQTAPNQAPIAVGEQFGVIEDGLLDSTSTGGLLANDHDPEGAQLTLELLAPPAHGVLAATLTGQFTYQPAQDFHGSDPFSYRVSDGVLNSSAVTATVIVFPQNDAPDAQGDVYQVLRDQALVVPVASGLLANDSDVDGDVITVERVDTPLRGQVVAAADGGFSYEPMVGVLGADRFRYSVTDGTARATALVTINVTLPGNRPPTAVGESIEVGEDGIVGSDSVGLLTANDSDPDGDALLVALSSPPAHGGLVLDGASFSYHPNTDFHGSDQFQYTVSDGALVAGPVTVQITVHPVNDAPRATTDVYVVLQGQSLDVAAVNGVLANDRDVDGDTLQLTLDSQPAHGQLALNVDGGFTYHPSAAFHGRDEFGYRISDGTLFAIGRAVIDVTQAPNQRPVAIGESFAIPEDTVLDTRTLQSLLANDVDPEGQPLSLVILTQPGRGLLEQVGAGHIRYTPARDDTGTVRFDYTVSDGELEALPVQVEILLMPLNDAPQATADLYALAPAEPLLTVSVVSGVLANDVDPDGDTLLVSVVQEPTAGTLNLGLDGAFTYTPTSPRPASDTFVYRVVDPAGLGVDAPVQILLNGDPPGEAIFNSGFEPNTP